MRNRKITFCARFKIFRAHIPWFRSKKPVPFWFSSCRFRTTGDATNSSKSTSGRRIISPLSFRGAMGRPEEVITPGFVHRTYTVLTCELKQWKVKSMWGRTMSNKSVILQVWNEDNHMNLQIFQSFVGKFTSNRFWLLGLVHSQKLLTGIWTYNGCLGVGNIGGSKGVARARRLRASFFHFDI